MGNYWFNGPNGWYQKNANKRATGAYRWNDTPMGKAETDKAALKAEYDKAYQSALNANQQRYTEILGGYDNLYNTTMTQMDGMGTQARTDVNSSYDKAFSRSMQGLVNAGMANSTIMPSVTMTNARNRTDALGRVNETLRREKLGYTNNITNNKLNFMERREDAYPDLGMYSSLMNSYGNSMGNIGYAPTVNKNKKYSYWN